MRQLIPVQKSLLRPDMLWGCERKLVLLLTLLVAILTIGALTLVSALIGTAIWLLGYAGLRKLASVDPQLSQVYLRYIRYRSFYPARADIDAPLPRSREIAHV